MQVDHAAKEIILWSVKYHPVFCLMRRAHPVSTGRGTLADTFWKKQAR